MLRELTGWKEKLQSGGGGPEGQGIFTRKGVCVWWMKETTEAMCKNTSSQKQWIRSLQALKRKRKIGETRGANHPHHMAGGVASHPTLTPLCELLAAQFCWNKCRASSCALKMRCPALYLPPPILCLLFLTNSKRKKRTALVMACAKGRGNSLSPPQLSFKANIRGFICFIKECRLHFIYLRNILLFLDVPKA